MDVVTELLDGHFTYNILKETGSETIRRRAMRGLLETEAEQAGAKDPSRFAVTPANYTLAGGEVADDGTVKLLAKPRRKDVGMVEGAVFVTSKDADIVRVEGRMVKSPSFWTTRVDVVKRYDVDGVHMDDYETHDDRRLLPGTGFTVEPGLYFESFGVRTEINMYRGEREAIVTGPRQTDVVTV